LPFFTRLVSYVLFWTYFSIPKIFLTEILTNEQLDGYKCFNLTIKVGGKLFKCEKYALKSLDELIDAMDQIAGIQSLRFQVCLQTYEMDFTKIFSELLEQTQRFQFEKSNSFHFMESIELHTYIGLVSLCDL